MIRIAFNITNPFAKENFSNLWNKFGHITEHKIWELEVCRYTRSLIEADFSFTLRQDHAGVMVGFGVFGYIFSAQIYDNRHWNTAANAWEEYTVDSLDG